MCAQQLIWCVCGHGEFLPIETCPHAAATGYCWTIVWGTNDADQNGVVVPQVCSYCKAGYGRARPLGAVRAPAAAAAATAGGVGVGIRGAISGVGAGPGGTMVMAMRPKHSAREGTVRVETRSAGAGGGVVGEVSFGMKEAGAGGDDGSLALLGTVTADSKPAPAVTAPQGPDDSPDQPDEAEWDWDDVMNTDFSDDFDLSDDFWKFDH